MPERIRGILILKREAVEEMQDGDDDRGDDPGKDAGPAPTTSTWPRASIPGRKLRAWTGVGLAQPMRGIPPGPKIWSMGMTNVPRKSKCGAGFRVTRPRPRAVSSPMREAIHAWADSWKDRLKRSTT